MCRRGRRDKRALNGGLSTGEKLCRAHRRAVRHDRAEANSYLIWNYILFISLCFEIDKFYTKWELTCSSN